MNQFATTTHTVWGLALCATLLMPCAASAQAPDIYLTPMDEANAQLPFASGTQALRGGEPLPEISMPVFSTTWSEALSGGSIVTGFTLAKSLVGNTAAKAVDKITDLDGIRFGAKGSVATSGLVDFSLRVKLRNQGQVQVDYPVTVRLSVPVGNTFRGGDTVVVRTGVQLDAGYDISTTPFGGNLGVIPTLALDSHLSMEGCVSDCVSRDTGVTLPPTSVEVLTVDSTNLSRINITFAETFIHGISGYYGFPNTATSGVLRDGYALSDSVTNQFTNLNFDLDSYATNILHTPPLGLSTPKIGGVQFGYETIDYSLVMQNSLVRHVDFVPNPQVTLALAAPLKWAVLAAGDDSLVVAEGHGNVITFHPGESLALTLPDGWTNPVTVTSVYSLPNQFTHREEMIHKGSYKNTAARISMAVPAHEIFGGKSFCLFGHINEKFKFVCDKRITVPAIRFPGVNFGLGPALVNEIPLATVTHTLLADKTTELLFTPLSGPNGLIDPENPIITVDKELSRVMNNGAGSRTVSYTMQVSNPGDVPLDEVSLTDLFQNTFPEADAFDFHVDEVQTCDLDLSAGFDGRGAGELLTVGQLMEVGDQALVNMDVTVWPKPFPVPFSNLATAAGTSVPRGTRVSDEGMADAVDMGPAHIDHLDDFVLFASHEVSFDRSGDIRGNVGAGDEINVEEDSDIVIAGDLFTPGEVEIEGRLVADYVFAGEEITQEEDGELIVTGHASSPATVMAFALDPVEVTAAGENITVTPEMGPISLAPASYGHIRVQPGATLVLSGGIYDLSSLSVGPEATDDDGNDDDDDNRPMLPAKVMFDLSAGPVWVNVADTLAVGDRAMLVRHMNLGSTRDITISVAGQPDADMDDASHHDGADGEHEIKIGQGAVITGNLVAPGAEIEFGADATLFGSARGREITLKDGASAWYHIDNLGSLYRLIDDNCDGVPNAY